MKHSGTLAVALMAGGRSTRMGRDKARLTDRTGRELWRGQLELLMKLETGELLISCREDQGYLVESGVRLVFDQWTDAGPLGGIVSCLEAMQAERLLVLAVDLPAMTHQVLVLLLEAAAAGGAVFRRAGSLEPLVAVYPKSMAAAGRRRLEAGDLALHAWIEEAGDLMRVVELPGEWSGALVNVNEPGEWERWMRAEP